MFCYSFMCRQRLLLLIPGILVLVTACTSPQKKLVRGMSSLQAQWQTNLAYQTQAPERTLDWPAALELLRANNLKLRQARTEVTNAQEAVRQVFRDLVPTLSMNAGVSKNLVDLPSVGANDVTFSVDSLFNVPGLVSFGARFYMTRLAKLRAEAAYALTEREQIIELYKLFWAAQEQLVEFD